MLRKEPLLLLAMTKKKVAALVKDIVTRYQIQPTNVLAHADIAPTRKQDPGPMFPWKKLYDEYQIGMWYDEAAKQTYLERQHRLILQQDIMIPALFSLFRRHCRNSDMHLILAENGMMLQKKTIETFQYHFRPQNYDGIMDGETWAILRALNQKYPTK